MSDIVFVNRGWFMWAFYGKESYIGIDNILEWLENFIVMSITHELVHIAIEKLEGYDTTQAFDNIFGYADPSILLCPEGDTEFDRVQRQRLKSFWEKKT